MKIPFKLILCYVIAVLLCFIIINSQGSKLVREEMLKEMEDTCSENARNLADGYVVNYYDKQITLGQMLTQLKFIDSLIDARIWLVNSKFTVVADSRSNNMINLIGFEETFLSGHAVYKENVMIAGVFTEPMMSVTIPVMYDFAIRGYVCIHLPMSLADQKTTTVMNTVNKCLLAVSGVLAFAFIGVYFFTAYPTRRIRTAALEYAKGNYSYPMRVGSRDEFGELSDAISYMVGEIKSVDDYQKKFIANISHDFRSPLTSIKGYAEAIKDGTIPPEAQNRYLDIILFETDRLTKLTSNLLDLNRIDSKGLMLDITSFDINLVIKNTAAAFEGICKKKKVVLNISFASKKTFVDADMTRIQQVLYNLTDNAIKFSNQDSNVDIETEEKGSKALIRIRDYGVGIPKESIKKIWDRFYKIDSSRGKDKKGTGLGLSIVKEVITAHEENISVVSTEGVGTEFTFTLPLSGL